MTSRRFAAFVAPTICLAASIALPAAGRASVNGDAAAVSGTVQFDQPAYTAHEDQGTLTITIERSGDLSQTEHVGYGVKQQDARNGVDFDAIGNHYITMAPGQASYSFQIQIIDDGINSTPVRAKAYLYGAYPQKIGTNNNAVITILRDDPLDVRDAADPLGVPGPYNGNLIAGTKLYVDPNSDAAKAARRFSKSKPAWSHLLGKLAAEPGAHRFYMWNMHGNIEGQVSHYLQDTQVQQPGTTVMVSTYNLVHDHCGYTATPKIQKRYDNWMQQVAKGIGNFHVIFFLEFDALITAPCLNHHQLKIREAELRSAVTSLEADPHTVVYLDAGAADAVHADKISRWLRASGVHKAQGFFVNSTHFDWTTKELYFGQEISQMLHGAHFMVNTGGNGRGPLAPPKRVGHGNEVLCNPPGRGLGPESITSDVAEQTGFADDDGLLWFNNPGHSGGQCVPGAPKTGVFWPARAVQLVRNWVNRVTGPKYPLRRARAKDPYAPTF
jgi:endoglucanase